MQLFEEKEYWEVFAKDSRNKKAKGGDARRNNRKEALKRMNRIQEKQEMAALSKPIVEESTDEDNPGQVIKKYNNGKIKKELKKQTHYFEDEEE